MGSTVGDRYVTGTVTAINDVLEIRKVGFKPNRVCIVNQTTAAKLEWNKEYPEGYGLKYAAAGDLSIITSAGISLLDGSDEEPPGFSVGAVADINDTTTEVLKYEAWG